MAWVLLVPGIGTGSISQYLRCRCSSPRMALGPSSVQKGVGPLGCRGSPLPAITQVGQGRCAPVLLARILRHPKASQGILAFLAPPSLSVQVRAPTHPPIWTFGQADLIWSAHDCKMDVGIIQQGHSRLYLCRSVYVCVCLLRQDSS